MKTNALDRLTKMANEPITNGTEDSVQKIQEEFEVKENSSEVKEAENSKTNKKEEQKSYSEPKRTEEFIGTKLFNVEAEGVIYPERRKRGEREAFKTISACIPESEYKYVEENARKHRMTIANYIRTLLINAD